jgi:hypothetical protein
MQKNKNMTRIAIKGQGLDFESEISMADAGKIIAYIHNKDEPLEIKNKKKPSNDKKSNPIKGEDSITELDIEAHPEGFPSYWDEKKKGKRITWILTFVYKKYGIDSLSSSDISTLAKKLTDDIPAKNVKALTEYSIKASYISPTSTGYRILKKGIDSILSKDTGDER